MSLPGITTPGSVPPFLVAGHAQQADGLFANLTTGAGHLRRRRIALGQLRKVSVEWFLTADQMAAVDDWFENALVAGSQAFAASVASEGTGAAWWTANWAAPYSAEPVNIGGGIVWHVVGQLVLSGISYTTGPTTNDLASELVAAFGGTVVVVADATLATEIAAALASTAGTSTLLAAEITLGIPGSGATGLAGDIKSEIGATLDGAGIVSTVFKVLQFAASDETTPFALGQLIQLPVLVPMQLTRVVATLNAAQSSGSVLTLNITKNGVSIFSTQLTIDNTETTSATAATPYALTTTTLAVDDTLAVIVAQIGDGTAAGLKLGLVGT